MDTGYKVYAEILRNRLDQEMESKDMLPDTQMGFRKGRGTIDAIYVLKHVAEKELRREGRELFAYASQT